MSLRFRSRQSGSLLVITLWLVTLLSLLAIAIGRYLSTEVRIAKYRLAREQAKALARGGIYLAAQRLAQDAQGESDGKVYDWLGDDWAVFPNGDPNDPAAWVMRVPTGSEQTTTSSGEVRIHMLDEERTLDLNAPATIGKLEQIVGSAPLAQALTQYLSIETAGEVPSTNPPYAQKNGPAVTLEELLDVPGMTPATLALLQRVVFAVPETNPVTTVNINTVSTEVLRLLGLSDSGVSILEQFRAKPDGFFTEAGLTITNVLKDREGVDLTGTADGNLLTSRIFGVASNTFTVMSEGIVASPAVRYCIEAVLQREDCKAGVPKPCIVAWKEPASRACEPSVPVPPS